MRSLFAAALVFASCAHAEPATCPLAPQLAEHVIPIGDVSEGDLGPVQKKFDELTSGGAKLVTFRIDSYGGSIDAGMDFIQHVEDVKKRMGTRVQCVVDSRAMSMGYIILQSTACDDRWMTRRSVLLAHQGSMQVQGTAESIRSALGRLEALNKALGEIATARLRISRAAYDEHVAHGDWTMAADEALDVGAVDGFVAPSDIPSPYTLDQADPLEALKKLFGGRI